MPDRRETKPKLIMRNSPCCVLKICLMPLFVWFQKARYDHKHDENDHSFSLKRLEGMKDYLITLDILYDYIYRVSQKKTGKKSCCLMESDMKARSLIS